MLLLNFIFLSGQVFCINQYFFEKPSNITLQERKIAIFPCRIKNLVGSVQWSKDGWLLGFEKEISGWPRYTMVINESLGVYNLLINGTTFEDSGQYECQVSGGNEIENLRASAYLTVLGKSKSMFFGSLITFSFYFSLTINKRKH